MATSVGSRTIGHSVRAPKTGELIADQLRAQIVRGELRPGDCLPSEVELMEQFEVSRPTLREAFRILETESLIMIRRGSRGARVITPSASVAARYFGVLLQVDGTTIADVYEARAVLEPAAAGLLAQRRTKQDLIDLNKCVKALEALFEADGVDADLEAWTQATYEFHELIVERAGNHTLAMQSRVLREVVATHLSLAVQRTFDGNTEHEVKRFRRTLRSYRKLIDLIEARDAAEASKHWQLHMDVAAELLLGGGVSSQRVLDLFD